MAASPSPSRPFIVVDIPTRWAGRVDLHRARHAEAAVRSVIEAVQPGRDATIRFTDGFWEWNYEAGVPSRTRWKIDQMLCLLAKRWQLIEQAVADTNEFLSFNHKD